MNKFTEQIHDKKMLVREFCEYWGISRRTYERMLADESRHDKLSKMIKGIRLVNECGDNISVINWKVADTILERQINQIKDVNLKNKIVIKGVKL